MLHGQEQLHQFDHFTHPNSPAAEVLGKVYISAISYGVSGDRTTMTSHLLQFDEDGNLNMVRPIDTNQVFPAAANDLVKASEHHTLYVGYNVTNNSTSQGHAYVIEYDTSFSEIRRFEYSDSTPLIASPLTLFEHSNEVIIAGGVLTPGIFVGSKVQVYRNDSLINEVNIPDFVEWINSSVKFGSKYVFGHATSYGRYMTVLNEDLSVWRVDSQSFANPWDRDYYDFIVSKDSNHLYAIGTWWSTHYTIDKFDKNLQLVRRDTLESFWPGFGKEMFSRRKNCSYRTPDSIFMLGGYWFPDGYLNSLNDTVKGPLQVVLADTAGNFHWNRAVGDADSAYYYPWTICATSDGGALIFSGKYDHTHSTNPHYFLSVIKIMGNGDVVSEKEYPLTSGRALEIFPNPVQNELKFQIPDNKKAQSYMVMSINGAVVADGRLASGQNSISVADLSAGVYFLSVVTTGGERYLSRFVKEN